MSLTSKDMVFGAAGAAAFLGLVVYHQHKFNKLQAEIDELKDETRIMAQYIKILESKVAGDFQTILSSHDGHHHHHAHAALPAQITVPQVQSPVEVIQPAIEDVKPQIPLIPESRKPIAQPVHVRQPVKQAVPARAQPVQRNPPPAKSVERAPVVKKVAPPVRQVPVRKPVVPVEEPSESVENSQDEDPEDKREGSDSENESEKSDEESVVQNSNRRGGASSNAKPAVSQTKSLDRGRPAQPNAGVRSINQPRNPVPQPKHVITVEEGKPPKDKEESYNPAEENNKAVEISGGRPTPPKASGPRTTGPKSGGEKKRFGPKVDESEDSDMYVSSSKVKTKSILKNPISGNKPTKDSETSIDADLADDMELVASKSAKRMEDNEGREVGPTEARMKMANTAKIAEDMRKKAEERAKKLSEQGRPSGE